MAILRYLTKLTGLQAGDEPEVHVTAPCASSHSEMTMLPVLPDLSL